MYSIFYSRSFSNESGSQPDLALMNSKNYLEACKELNNSAVDFIREGIEMQEEEDSDRSDDQLDEEDRMIKAQELFDKAK